MSFALSKGLTMKSAALFDAAHSKVDVGISREEHDLCLRPHAFDLVEPEDTLIARVDTALEVHVEQYHVGLILTQSCGDIAGTGDGDDLLEGVFEDHPHCGKDITVVVDDKDRSVFHADNYFLMQR